MTGPVTLPGPPGVPSVTVDPPAGPVLDIAPPAVPTTAVVPVGGPAGVGVPPGGSTGQALTKKSGADYDSEWSDESGGGGDVASVNGKTGVVVLDADDVAATATNQYLTGTAQTIDGDKTFAGTVKIVNQAQLGSAILTVPTSDYYILSLVETSSGTTWENWIEDGGYGGTVGSLYWDVVAGASGTSGAVVFGPDGRLGIGIGYTVVGAALDILSKNPAILGLRIKAAAGQTADLVSILDSSNVAQLTVTAAGDVNVAALSGAGNEIVGVDASGTFTRVPVPASAPNILSIGTVTEGAAAASITGTSPAQVLNLTLPKGDPGAVSTVPGPANVLTIGTVDTGTAAASITGTAPDQVLNLTIPAGGVTSVNGATGAVTVPPEFLSIGSTAPDTTGWPVNGFWYDTSTET